MKVCRGCGLEVPDEARICPKCGRPFRMPRGNGAPPGRWLVVAALLVVLAISGFVVALSAGH